MANLKKSWARILERWLGGGLIELPDNIEVTPSGGLRVELDDATLAAARARARRIYGLKEDEGRASVTDPESDSAKGASAAWVLVCH